MGWQDSCLEEPLPESCRAAHSTLCPWQSQGRRRLGSRSCLLRNRQEARARSEAWLLQGHSIPAARGEDKRGINMAKWQKQEQTFPPQLGGTELSPSAWAGAALFPAGSGTQGQPKVSQGCLGWKPQGREGAELDVEHWGSSIPKTWGKELAARGNTDGLSSSRSLYSPTAPAEPGREVTSLPPRAAVGWGEPTRPSVGLEQDIPALDHSQHRLLPTGWASSAGHAGDTQLSPNPEPSRGTEE